MERLLPYLLSSAVLSTIVVALVLLFECFPKAVSARSRYAAWIVLLVGFLLPIRPIFFGPAVNVAVLPYSGAPAGEVQGGFFAEAIPYQLAQTSISAQSLVLVVWLLGAVLFFSHYTAKHIRFMRFVKRWSTEAPEETVFLQKFLKECDIKNVELKKCDFLSTSLLVGFFRPTIVLPGKDFDECELELIFRHELVHYSRRDLLAKLLSMVVVSVHWFNPAVYLLSASMQADLEASCDETVLAQTGEGSRLFYAELIIAMIGTKKQFASPISTCFYGSKRSVKKRMGAIIEFSGKLGKPSVFALLALFSVTVLSGSVFALTEQGHSWISPEIQIVVDSPYALEDAGGTDEVPSAREDAGETDEVPLAREDVGDFDKIPSTPDDTGEANQAPFTRDDAVHTALQLIQGGVVTDVSVNTANGSFRIEVVRDANLYLLTITKDGIVTVDQTISIYEHQGQQRRGRMMGR